MQMKLLPLLRCPADGTSLRLEEETQTQIETGTLVCTGAGHRYPTRHGMAYLYVDDEKWRPKAREALGWVKYHQDRNIYDQSGVDIDFQLPYFPHDPWKDIARQFDIAIELINPQPGAWVLDVGAGRGWGAKHFALRGCQAVAVEINDDDQIGLGRSRAMMKQADVIYDLLIADSENLPFAAGCFDIVFSSAALHHTSHLDQLVAQIARVLRPGGTLIAINEPCLADKHDEAELQRSIADERSYGINENHPHLDDYREALRQAGLREQLLFAWHAYGMTVEALTSWSAELNVAPPAAFDRAATSPLTMLWRKWRGRNQPAAAQRWSLPQRWMDNLLRERGGGIILTATK